VTRSIAEWQKISFENAHKHGFHSRECLDHVRVTGVNTECPRCNGTGQVEVDHKSPTRIASRLALIHCEISEAVECVVRGRMELYWEPTQGPSYTAAYPAAPWHKPEGFGIELADVFLRLCDLAESLGVELNLERDTIPARPDLGTEAAVARLGYLHELVPTCERAEDERRRPRYLNSLLSELFLVADSHNIDLLAMAELKHEYNVTRPYMHGGKLL